jgi:hypothetical protein
MQRYSINVKIATRSFFPWEKQKIQVEGEDMFAVKRSYRLFSGITRICVIESGDTAVRITQPRLPKSDFEVEMADKHYRVRRISYWQWECRSEHECIMLHRMGGMKCILTQNGRQLAIMTLGSDMPFVEDNYTYLRVNSDENLHLAMATALIVKSIGVHIKPLLNEAPLRPMQAVELA